jgi:UDP-glucose 4-epimerase
MKALVVGGSGFVGRHVVRRLVARGHAVVNVARQKPLDPQERESVVVADVTGRDGLRAALASGAGSDAVVWLAAAIRQQHGVEAGAREDLELMVEAPLRLLDGLRPAPRSVVYLSSVQVYGRPERMPVDEDHPTRPFTAYGVSKLCAEQMLALACAAHHDVAFCALRVAFVYGPGQHAQNVIPRFLERVRAGQPPVVHGLGTDVRDDVYVADVADSVVAAVERQVSGVFNVGSGAAHSLADVAREAGLLAKPALEPVFEDRESRWVDRWYSIERARRELGLQPTPFAEGLLAQWKDGA